MKKKTVLIVLAILVVVAAVLAIVISSGMPKKEANEIILVENGAQTKVDLNSLKLVDVKGTMTMESGKVKEIDSKGVELKVLLDGKTYTTVKVSADDNYSAELTAEDIAKDGNAYIILGEENKPRLIVFSDTNAKRDVKNILTIELMK